MAHSARRNWDKPWMVFWTESDLFQWNFIVIQKVFTRRVFKLGMGLAKLCPCSWWVCLKNERRMKIWEKARQEVVKTGTNKLPPWQFGSNIDHRNLLVPPETSCKETGGPIDVSWPLSEPPCVSGNDGVSDTSKLTTYSILSWGRTMQLRRSCD